MGIFDFVKKAVKSITKGISKIFKSVTRSISRIGDSDWGRTLLVGAAIFTGGMALSGGFEGWNKAAANGEGFLGKFVGGAEGFVTALSSPIDQANKMIARDPSVTPADTTAGVLTAGQETPRPDVAMGQPGALESAQAAQRPQAPSVANAQAQAPAQKPPEDASWLEKAAGYAMDFIQSPVGAQMIQGYSAGKVREEEMRFEDRVRRSWQDPNNALAQLTKQGVGSRFISRGNIPAYNPGKSSVTGASTTGALPGEPVSPGLPVGA